MALPLQRLPFSKKNLAWKKENIDSFEKLSYASGSSTRSSNYNKKINYDLLNGKFNKADLAYVCDPLGMGAEEYPATLQNMDIVSPPCHLLISEEGSRPDNCVVLSESPESISKKQEALKGKIMASLEKMLMGAIDPSTIDPNNPPPTPEVISKYERYNISDLIESKANKLHKHLKRYLNTKEIFKKGFKDVICAGEEIYWSGISGNEVILRRCNPLNIAVVLDGDTDYIDDAIAVVEKRMLAPSTILDEFGDDLSLDDIKKLEQYSRRAPLNHGMVNGDNPGFRYTPEGVEDTGINSFNSTTTTGSYLSELVRVIRVEWKSLKKLYHLSYTDEEGMLQEIVVDEVFNIQLFKKTYPDALTEEFWINEAWEGIKIGDDIYIGVQPKPNQRRKLDNPYYCKLGYTGLLYNTTNSRSVSLMDRLKPYQYLYNIIFYRLELAFASDMGKVFLMDLAQIPRSEGIDIERWMYYLKTMKMAFINSFEEGKKGQATGQFASARFNQFQSVDLTLANTIQQYIQTLDYIKQQVAFVSGVSPQRLGAIENRELVGNVEKAVQQSALITEHLFDAHDEVKRRCYISLIECAKIAYKDGKKIQYILDDMGIELLNIEESEFDDINFNVYMSSATRDNKIINDARQLFSLAIQHDKVDLSTIVDSIINDSPRDMLRTIQRAEKDFYARQKESEDKQLDVQRQAAQIQKDASDQILADKEADRQLRQYEIDTNNETKIMVAEISALRGKDGPSDMDGDGIPDPIEVAKVSLEQHSMAEKAYAEKQKLDHEKDKHTKEMTIKDREIKMKQDIENKKIEAIRVQNQSQEKIATDANKLKEKELEIKKSDQKIKLEIEKIKLAAAKHKAQADAKKASIQIKKASQSAKPKPKK